MKILSMAIDCFGRAILAPTVVALGLGFAALAGTASAQVESTDGPSPAEAEAMQNYQSAKAGGRHAEAVKYLLDYMQEFKGENDPLTVSLTQRYGKLLREEGDISGAISVLKQARKRGIAAHGEHGIELFEINMDLGDAYVDRGSGIGRPRKYYDDALEVLRRNDQRETLLYVTSLVNVASRLTQAGGMGGTVSADTGGIGFGDPAGNEFESLTNTGQFGVTSTYRSGYRVLEEYLEEATELADALESEDPYLGAKIAVVQAKIKVTDTIYLESLPPSVRGGVSGAAAKQKYRQEDDNLSAAIDLLKEDAGGNQAMLEIANNARMDLAWLSEDMQRLADFCDNDTVNMASRYPRDRLFEVAEDGTVDAPRFPFVVSNNIFRRSMQQGLYNRRGPEHIPENRPQFVPVCIDGRLMAALVNAPRVTIEEFE